MKLSMPFLLLLHFLLCNQLQSQTTHVQDSLANLQLFQTIRSGNDKSLDVLLKYGANPNAVLNGYSALMAATLNGSPEQMKLLLQHGAQINYCNADSISAIWLAIPDMEKTSLLLKNGANVQQRSREGNTLIVKLAAMPGTTAILDTLLKAGCSLRDCSKANNALYNAAASGDTAILGRFIRAGISVNDTCSIGDYPINAALNFRSFATVKMLVDNGADVNPKQVNSILPLLAGVTPLMWSAVSNDAASFFYLLNHGANPKAISPGGYTTLMYLARSQSDDPAMTRALIERGVDPRIKALDETDALYHYKQRGNTPSITLLNNHSAKKQ